MKRGLTLRGIVRRWLRRFLDSQVYVTDEFKQCHPSVNVDDGVYISAPGFVSLEKGVAIYRGSKIFCGPGEFIMQENSHLSGDVYINALQGYVKIGKGTAVGPKTVILSYSNHYRAGETVADSRITGDVIIGDDVFIGAAVIVMPGIRIGDGAIIGAGSIVTADVGPFDIAYGNPARKRKTRPPNV